MPGWWERRELQKQAPGDIFEKDVAGHEVPMLKVVETDPQSGDHGRVGVDPRGESGTGKGTHSKGSSQPKCAAAAFCGHRLRRDSGDFAGKHSGQETGRTISSV